MVFYEHIYTEDLKNKKKDSVFSVLLVKDGKVDSKEEVEALAWIQLLDYIDGKTKNHEGKTVPFTESRWEGRERVLEKLAERYGGKRTISLVSHLADLFEEGKISKKELKEIAIKKLKELDKKGRKKKEFMINWKNILKL